MQMLRTTHNAAKGISIPTRRKVPTMRRIFNNLFKLFKILLERLDVGVDSVYTHTPRSSCQRDQEVFCCISKYMDYIADQV